MRSRLERNLQAQVANRALHQAQNPPHQLHVLALEQLQVTHILEEIGTTMTQIILTTVTKKVTTIQLTTAMKTKTTSMSVPSRELHTAQAAT